MSTAGAGLAAPVGVGCAGAEAGPEGSRSMDLASEICVGAGMWWAVVAEVVVVVVGDVGVGAGVAAGGPPAGGGG